MKITVSTVKPTTKAKKQWRPQKRGLSSNQLEARLRKQVVDAFSELDFYVSKGGQRFDESVTFSTRGWGLKDLVFKNEGGLTKWQNAKKWLVEAKAWRG